MPLDSQARRCCEICAGASGILCPSGWLSTRVQNKDRRLLHWPGRRRRSESAPGVEVVLVKSGGDSTA